MAKPYLLYKTSNNIYYAEILLPDGSHANKKSTGCKNRADAERAVMGWIVNGTVPVRSNGKVNKKIDVNKITLLNNLRNYDFTTEEVKTIAEILKNRKLIQSFAVYASPQSKSIEEFLDEFWDFDTSPYIREKKLRGQSIHRDYCVSLQARLKRYWYPHIAGKSVGEITREDITGIFSDKAVAKLAPKTINSIISAITIPMKWAYCHGLTDINCYDEIIKCSTKSKKREVLTLEQAMAVFCTDWENDTAKLANMLAFYTGMRQGEIAALRLEDIGTDRIYIRHSWSKYEGLLENIGYSDPKKICFHAWRHLWCSRISDLISDKRVIMTGSGHKTEFMLDHYAEHLEREHALEKLQRVQEKVFLPVIKKAESGIGVKMIRTEENIEKV
ncbi:hypothetical protein [Treponema socranskii]|uniref:tyrosine-type recombinase/integrase n=1 Tax=Treponema socranskii TaxID=53419 RepID=UPI002051E975|nr:hypothetical protein [Treponema socranskii]DAV37473.1 MAG TPA: Integrase [Bacteriophage sp.]